MFRKNRIQGRFLKIEVKSTFGAHGGLQFIGLTGRNLHSAGYKPGYSDSPTKKQDFGYNSRTLENYCKKESAPETVLLRERHCQSLSYVLEGKSISPRCPQNCACCKQGGKLKTGIVQHYKIFVW